MVRPTVLTLSDPLAAHSLPEGEAVGELLHLDTQLGGLNVEEVQLHLTLPYLLYPSVGIIHPGVV